MSQCLPVTSAIQWSSCNGLRSSSLRCRKSALEHASAATAPHQRSTLCLCQHEEMRGTKKRFVCEARRLCAQYDVSSQTDRRTLNLGADHWAYTVVTYRGERMWWCVTNALLYYTASSIRCQTFSHSHTSTSTHTPRHCDLRTRARS